MDQHRKKRPRHEDLSECESDEHISREISDSSVYSKSSSGVFPPLPKLGSQDNSSIPIKKPKPWDYDQKRTSSSLHSGILQCLKGLQDSIRNIEYDLTLDALTRLSSELTMSNEDHLSILPIENLTESLMTTLNIIESPEIVLQSIICINFLIESHQHAIGSFVKAGVIAKLTSKLMSIQFIDLAEYSVKALEKISAEFPVEVLKQGFVLEIFTVLNFFEQSIQKRILGIVLNMSKAVHSLEDFNNYIYPCMPFIVDLLQNKDKEFIHQLEKSIEILIALSESVKIIGSEEILNSLLIEYQVVQALVGILLDVPGVATKSLRLLNFMCRNSLKITLEFFQVGLKGFLGVFDKGTHENNIPVVTESLNLLGSIIPRDSHSNPLRYNFFMENVEYLNIISEAILPQIIVLYDIIASKAVKIQFLDIIENIIISSSPATISKHSLYSQFLSNLLVEKDGGVLTSSLRIVSTLYDKIPELISSSFIREGVVQRFKALKLPENLKNITEEKHSDPNEFENFLINYRRSRAYSEHIDLHSAHQRPRLSSEYKDPNYDQKKEITTLSKLVIEKHNKCNNKSALSTIKSLKNLAVALDKSHSNTADEIWEDFGLILDTMNPTAYEFSKSMVCECLWNWLSSSLDTVNTISRYTNFISFLIKQSRCGGIYFNKLLSLVLQTFGYTENSVMLGKDKRYARAAQHKTRIHFQYTPSSDRLESISNRINFFASINKFSISPNPGCTVRQVKSMLFRVENKEDLSFLKEIIRENPMDLDYDPERKDIKIVFMLNDKELSDHVLLEEVMTLSAETPVIMFKFMKNNVETEYLSKDEEIYKHLLQICTVLGIQSDNPAFLYLRFIKLLFITSCDFPLISSNTGLHMLKQPLVGYLSPKLNSIAVKYFEEPISLSRRSMPDWVKVLPKDSWFLFSFPNRLKILDNYRYVQNESYRVPRHKVKIDRDNILDGAIIIMNDSALIQQGILEVQYENEMGTGNGPTLEFFTIVSQNIRQLNIWRKNTLLFPAPHQLMQNNYFNFIGKIVGKAIVDRRYIDLPLSPVFWKLVHKKAATMKDVSEIEPSLGKTLLELQSILDQNIQNPSIVSYKGVPIEDLHLYFTLPGYESIELIPGGRHVQVTLENLQQYIDLVSKETLMQIPQIAAFREGLNSLIPVEALEGFSSEELEEIICGSSNSNWDLEILRKSIKPAHGYSDASATFQNLLQVMSEFSSSYQRKFLQFTTGCPRLPLGGFSGLVPCLTVVRKEDGDDADKYLPSVMTCQNYLKLPNYSSISILRKNLNLALEEGYQTFHLS